MTTDRPTIEVRDDDGAIITRPMNDEELANLETAMGTSLAHNRLVARNRVLSILSDTDEWAARAYEEGVPMPQARVAYRQALRGLLSKIAESDDPLSLELPAVPVVSKP